MRPTSRTRTLLAEHRLARIIICLSLSLWAAGSVWAEVTLTVGSVEGARGSEVEVPISIDVAGENASSFDFDVVYDNTKLQPIAVTAGPVASGKSVNFTTPSNRVLVVISGPPVAVVSGVLANLRFEVLDQAQTGQVLDLVLENATAADTTVPLPNPVAVTAVNGAITITGVLVPVAGAAGLAALLVALGALALLLLLRHRHA